MRYCEEIAPKWTETGRTFYADNSVEATQVSVDGRTRRVLVTAPNGDAC